MFLPMIKTSSDKKKANQQNTTLHEQYNQKVQANSEAYRIACATYSEDMRKWEADKAEMHAFLAGPLEKSKWILSKVYENELIYPKYHNLPALTSICEYLITGRCDELTGPHGAYNLYEDEVRKDTIISQMNTIIANLESIKTNQYMLYQQVVSIKSDCDRIGAELRQIKGLNYAIAELTMLNTYYEELQARNTGFIAAHHLLS